MQIRPVVGFPLDDVWTSQRNSSICVLMLTPQLIPSDVLGVSELLVHPGEAMRFWCDRTQAAFITDQSGDNCCSPVPSLRGLRWQRAIIKASQCTHILHIADCYHVLLMCEEDCPSLCLWQGSVAGTSGRPRHATRGPETPGTGHRCSRSDACM